MLVTWQWVGLRNTIGRFASMRDRRLLEIQLTQGYEVGQSIAEVYRNHAPRGEGDDHGTDGPLADSIKAEVAEVEGGFSAGIKVEGEFNQKKRLYLLHGTGPRGDGTFAAPASKPGGPKLHFTWKGSEWFRRSTQGMEANDWEERARPEADDIAREGFSRLGHQVVKEL